MIQTQLHHTASLLAHWLRSCDTLEQLALFPNLFQPFIIERFQARTEQYILDLTMKNLQRELRRKFKELRVPLPLALQEEKEVYPRCFDYYINLQGRIVSVLKSVAV